MTAASLYTWGPLDREPLSALSLDAAQAVALDPDTYRAGCALLTRAPWHILAAWEHEELSTPEAYAALMKWERGKK